MTSWSWITLSAGRPAALGARGNILAVPFSDTNSAAQTFQFEIERSMTGEQRLLLALEMSMFARQLTAVGIRIDHPEWTNAQITRELLRMAFLPEPLPDWLDKRLSVLP